jgi:hypothetical protein
MFIKLFSQLYRLIASPYGTWNELMPDREAGNESFNHDYFHPVTGVIALVSFLGVFLAGDWSFSLAIKAVIREAGTVFCSLYLSACCIRFIAERRFGISLSMLVCEKYTGYASAAVYVSVMAAALFPNFSVFHLAAFYSVGIAIKGGFYLGVKRNFEWFTITAAIIIVLVPFLLRGLLYVATK